MADAEDALTFAMLFKLGTPLEKARQLREERLSAERGVALEPEDWMAQEIAALNARLVTLQDELMQVRECEQRARHLALHDDLTALPNRRCFRERLGAALGDAPAEPPELAVIYLDIDGFKSLNDEYGHDIGDGLLNLVAARLARVVRAEDLVSRVGGDEYACLISGISSRKRLEQMATSLFDAVSQRFNIGPLTLNVRPSIGIAVCPGDGVTTDALLKAADAAMYEAKRNRSTFAFFRPESARLPKGSRPA